MIITYTLCKKQMYLDICRIRNELRILHNDLVMIITNEIDAFGNDDSLKRDPFEIAKTAGDIYSFSDSLDFPTTDPLMEESRVIDFGLEMDRYEAIFNDDPDNFDALLGFGSIYLEMGDPNLAQEYFSMAFSKGKFDSSSIIEIADAYFDEGKYVHVEIIYTMVPNYGKNIEALQGNAKSNLVYFDYEEGRIVLVRILNLDPGNSNARTMLDSIHEKVRNDLNR